MDYRYLRAFLTTAKHASFSKAARELHIAQSAVSRQVRLLEESLQCQLLVRSPQSVILTDKGRRLFEQASKLDDWSRQEFTDEPTNIRIGTIPGLLDSFLIPKVAKFAVNRDLNFHLRSDNQPTIAAMLERAELDACIAHAPIELPGVRCKKIRTEDIYLISKSKVTLDALADERWIHMGTAQLLKKISKTVSKREIVVNSMGAMVELVMAGVGVAAVPDYVLSAANKKRLTFQKLNMKGQIYLAVWDYGVWPAHMREFFACLVEIDER